MKLTPFLLFDGDCADAMHFYQGCLGGNLSLTRLGDTPMRESLPAEAHDRIAHARLVSGTVELSATDWLHPTRLRVPGNSVAVYLEATAGPELEVVFSSLAQGGDPLLRDDPQDTPFGRYGHLADRFGVHWFFRSTSQAVAADLVSARR